MRRTQLYLDEDLWSALHEQARSRRTTISELAREAIRERYLEPRASRIAAMQAVIGIHPEPPGAPSAVEVVRRLRRGSRLRRLTAK